MEKENGSINLRIQSIVDELFDGNKNKFCRTAHLSATGLNGILGDRQSKPSFDVISKIGCYIDNINVDWLIHGTGEMLKRESKPLPVPVDLDRLDLILELSKSMKQHNEMLSMSLVEAKNEIADLKKQLAQKDKDADKIRFEYREILKQKDLTIKKMGDDLLKYSDSTTTGESELAHVG